MVYNAYGNLSRLIIDSETLSQQHPNIMSDLNFSQYHVKSLAIVTGWKLAPLILIKY